MQIVNELRKQKVLLEYFTDSNRFITSLQMYTNGFSLGIVTKTKTLYHISLTSKPSDDKLAKKVYCF